MTRKDIEVCKVLRYNAYLLHRLNGEGKHIAYPIKIVLLTFSFFCLTSFHVLVIHNRDASHDIQKVCHVSEAQALALA